MNIVAIDPGGQCGMALLLEEQSGSTLHLMMRSAGSELLRAEWCLSTAVLRECELMIIEKFIPQPGKGYTWQSLSPMRIGSMIETLIWERMIDIKVVWQTPSDKAVITDERLKAWGVWKAGHKYKDAMDALKHLIVYLRRAGLPWHPAEWYMVA